MKIKNCTLTVICIAVFFTLCPTRAGFAGDSTLQVKCVDASGNPMQGVKIVIFSLNNQKTKDKKSNAQGTAEFTKLDDGVYRIFGRKDGFAPALFEFASLKGSSESVTLKFATGADKKLYFEDPAENKRAMDLMRQGLEAYKQKKFEDAENLFGQSLAIDPSNPETYYYSAISCLQQSKFDRGVELLKRASELATELKALPVPASGQNPYDQLRENVQQLLKKMPAIKGEVALNNKKYDQAIADFSEAVKANPDNSEYYANLAIAYTNAKKFDEAMAAIEKADQLKPGAYADLKKNITARQENAEIAKAQTIMDDGKKLLKDGDAAGALKKFEEAKSMVEEDRQSPLWSQIARAQAKMNQPEAAVASFKKAIELSPPEHVAEYRNSLAQFYLDEKKYEQALDVLADPKAAGSQSVEQVLLSLAASAKNKQPQLAEAALESVLKANPENAEVYFELGEMYYADGKEKDSRTKELLTKFIEIGKDPAKIESAKNMLVMVDRRSK